MTDTVLPQGTLTIVQALRQALAHHQAGRLPEAEHLYRAILQVQPSHPDANHNLGVLAVQLSQIDAAVEYFRKAMEADTDLPQYRASYFDILIQAGYLDVAGKLLSQCEQLSSDAHAHYSLGVAMHRRGRLESAAASYRMALQIKSDYAEVHNNMGVVLKASGQLEGAVMRFRKALEYKPDYAEAHNNLGNTLKELMQFDDAVSCFIRALKIMPDYAEAHSNLGCVLLENGQFEAALTSCRRALEIKPDLATAYINLGAALQGLGQIDDAMVSYRQALELNPDLAMAHNNLGNAQREVGQFNGALASYRRALEVKPDFVMAHNNMGNTMQDLGQLENAIESYLKALEIKPDLAATHSNMGVALQDLGRLADACVSYRLALKIKPEYTEAYSNLLFILNYMAEMPVLTLRSEALLFGDMVARQACPFTAWNNLSEPSRCLRVGLISGDLRNHSVGHFVEGVLRSLKISASGRMEITAYHNHFSFDVVSERIKGSCHGWHTVVGLSDADLAKRIRDDDIDILIDLSGHTAYNRLPMFALKPAPVQVSWLGYFATTGLQAMDYLIADPWTVPEPEEVHFTEKICRLPETYLCFTPPDIDVQVGALPVISKGYITFGCFNNLTKMNDSVVALWARVLNAVPGSRLFLKAKQLGEATVCQSVISRFASHRIDEERLILEGGAPRSELLAAYRRVDIALDPFPYPGGTTSIESLWMGVPVLTLAGDRFLSHIGESIMQNAGLPEYIAADQNSYVALAVLHAGDLSRLKILRSGLRQQVLDSPLFDAPRFARHFEAALRGMWVQWCNQQQGKIL